MYRIIYFSPNESSFVKRDINELKRNYEVIHFIFKMEKKILIPYYFLKQFFVILINIGSVKFFLSRFGGYHSFLPSLIGRMFRIKHFIILCGVDCNILHLAGYGHGLRPLLKFIITHSMRSAHMLLPVSRSLVSATYTYSTSEPSYQGYKNIYNGVETRYMVIPDGIDTSLFRLTGNERDFLSFVTISSGLESATRRLIKGIDIFVKCAEAFPEYSFTIIGNSQPADMPVKHNLHFIPFVNNTELSHILNRFGFYMQLSMSEGFSNALLEAMACGCIPIVSNVGIMPVIVGDFGYVLEKKDVEELKKIVQRAVGEIDTKDRVQISSHIYSNYSIKIRSDMLMALLRGEE